MFNIHVGRDVMPKWKTTAVGLIESLKHVPNGVSCMYEKSIIIKCALKKCNI